MSLSRNPAQQLVKNVANLTLLEKKTQEVNILTRISLAPAVFSHILNVKPVRFIINLLLNFFYEQFLAVRVVIILLNIG